MTTLAVFAPCAANAADPSALWKIVSGKCVPHEQVERDPSRPQLVLTEPGVPVQESLAASDVVDGLALMEAKAALAAGDDQMVARERRLFFYL